MKSLIVLAQENTLPDYQYMDLETLSWIINNPPQIVPNINQDNPSIDIELIKRFIPKREWFLNDEIIDSIHGVRHLGRCLAYALILSKNETINNELVIATALHDIARRNDKGDPGHGERAAIWFDQNIKIFCKYFGIDKIDSRIIIDAIKYHEIPYENIPENIITYSGSVINTLKSADALDRYIQPKLKWRIDDSLLKDKPTDSEKLFAYNLVIESEKNFLSGLSSEKAIINALKEYEIR